MITCPDHPYCIQPSTWMQTPSSRILFSIIIDILFIYPYKDDARRTAPVHDVIHHSTAKNSALSSLSYARPGIHSLLLGMTELRCWVSCSMSAYRPGPMHPSMIPSPTSANNSSSPKILMECRSCTLQPHAASPRERVCVCARVRVRVRASSRRRVANGWQVHAYHELSGKFN